MRKGASVYLSLLVRLWYVPTREGGRWEGEVEHVQSGRRWWFGDLESMVKFLSVPEGIVQSSSGIQDDSQ